MKKIVIIDDGISLLHAGVRRYQIDCRGQVSAGQSGETSRSHGTTCYEIIGKYAGEKKQEWDWYSIQALNPGTREGKAEHLLTALRFAGQIGAKVIHLSIGTRNYADFPPLERQVKILYEQGVILVAALNNEQTITYPACLPYVFAVASEAGLRDGQYRAAGQNPGQVDFFASGTHLLRESGRVRLTPTSNSFAAPVITAQLLRIVSEGSALPLAALHQALVDRAPIKIAGHATSPDFFVAVRQAVFWQIDSGDTGRSDGLAKGEDTPSPAVIDPSQIIKGNLPYPCRFDRIAAGDTARRLRERLCGSEDLVVLAPREEDPGTGIKVYKALRSCYQGKIAVLTTAPGRLERIGEQDHQLWACPQDPWMAERGSHTTLDMPLLVLTGLPREKARKLQQGLARRFTSDGYTATLLSDDLVDTFFGRPVLYRDRSLPQACRAYASFYQSDVLLVTLTREQEIKALAADIDIYLTGSDAAERIKSRLRTDQALLDIGNIEEEEIYTQLMRLLS